MIDPDSKQQKVMACLKKFGNTLTQKEAIYYFEHYRLASVVDRMKTLGYNIVNIGDPGKHAIYKRKRW